jgi:anti-anti-sigma regulatory factor
MSANATGLADIVAPFGLGVRRLGERTCVVSIGTDLRRTEAPSVSEAAGQAAADGCRDFVFDLTYVRRYERVALGWMADLWARLGDAGCDVFVAAREPGVVRDLCELPTDDGWTLLPSATKALRALLSKPVG